MRSFSTLSLLVTAALSVFTNAAPIDLPLPALPALPTPSGVLSGVTSADPAGLKLRAVKTVVSDAAEGVESKISTLGARDDSPSVAVIFTNIQTEITPYTEQLNCLVPENATLAIITPIVSQIKGSLLNALPQLQALVGQELSVILASVEGDVTLTVSELAEIVGSVLLLIFTALGAVIQIVVGEVSTDVLPILTDLGCTVTSLMEVVVTLVGGIVALLLPLLAPVVTVLSVLELNDFASLLGLSL
ncbi:hypothetical protein BU15DRAFT_79981 [Melanogaster broomeanus]|nr:hypothetical protein BU15DRAFT_79981 [Melanogaster broomeanus]